MDFQKQIQPLFQEKCFNCHGPEKQKGGLRLDLKSAAMIGGDSGTSIEPGKPDESRLFKFVSGLDPENLMPPKGKGKDLTAGEIELLRKWIADGAPWPDSEAPQVKHWAYQAPKRPALPKVEFKKWPGNEIDFFVLSRLEKEKLRPSMEADPETLIRRVSLDLTGLPPTPEEVDAFLADKSPQAYANLVERLLASPHYGERWARLWLDLARYADTQGYEKDNRRTIWPYRDWVIKALNSDLSFADFTLLQLAGDLLPNAGREEKVATGFHRNTMTNTEGGTDNEEFRHEAIVDRVNTTLSVWMGTTMACAQCHNHKYDPITMKEYYQIYAFLNNTADEDRDDEKPILRLGSKEQEEKLVAVDSKVSVLEKEYAFNSPELEQAQEKWEVAFAEAEKLWQVANPKENRSEGGATLNLQPDGSVLVSGKNPSNDVYQVTLPAVPGHYTAVRLEVLPDPVLPHSSLGRHSNGSFVLTRFEAAVVSEKKEEARPVRFGKAFADYSQKDHPVANLINTNETRGWAVSAADPEKRVKRTAQFIFAKPVELKEGEALTITLRHSSPWPEANLGRFRLSTTSISNPAAGPETPEKIRNILALPRDKRSKEQGKELNDHWRTVAPELKSTRDALAAAKNEKTTLEKIIPSSPVLVELEKPRATHLLQRGNFLSKGDKVNAGVPAVFPAIPADAPANRLTLARWLVSENNPLTARVTMNRIWESYFGTGIMETGEDFGKQGEVPSHPELLDWLATEFMAQNWSMKAMHRVIVNSATYRQSSRVDSQILQKDPFNRLFARGPRVRLEAESLRDQALAVSGLLSRKIGGPSVMPPQPDGLWMVVYSGDKWETSRNEDKYRRGIYTFWRRTMPHPAMSTFDAPSREFCVTRRSRSNTPLQALTILNDPAYVEAAQALAERVLNEGGATDEERLHYAFKVVLARAPKAEETRRLLKLLQTERHQYQRDPGLAEKMTSLSLRKGSQGDAAELAAWTVVANVFLNLDEFITKG